MPRFQHPNGFLAVDFFFCLSGFVIAYSYAAKLEDSLGVGEFSLLRVIRLYPMFLLGTMLMFFRTPASAIRMQYLHEHPFSFWTAAAFALFFLPNLFTPTPLLPGAAPQALLYPFNGPGWSLFYELLSNVSYAVLVKRRWDRIVLPMCGIASAIYLLIVAGMGTVHLDGGINFRGLPIALARVGFSFSAGVYLFHVYAKGPRRRRGLWATLLPAILLVSCLMLNTEFTRSSWAQAAFMLAISPLLVWWSSGVDVSKGVRVVCDVLGEMSYPLYAIHIALVFTHKTASHLNEMQHWKVIAALWVYVLTLGGVAYLIGRYIDFPVRKSLTAWRRSRRMQGSLIR
jgi:peptidoglycan/LPS O-acetylase OafA/YrhL